MPEEVNEVDESIGTDEDENDLDYADTDLTQLPDAALLDAVPELLRRKAEELHARGVLDGGQRREWWAREREFLEQADKVEENAWDFGSLEPGTLGQVAQIEPRVSDEIGRRMVAAAEAKLTAEREAQKTDEQREAEAKQAEEDAALQRREDNIQAEIDQTLNQWKDKGAYANPKPTILVADGAGSYSRTDRPGEIPVRRDANGAIIRDKSGHAIPVLTDRGGYARPSPLTKIKALADEWRQTEPADRAAFWEKRSQVERDILERGFGVRPPLSQAESDEIFGKE